MNNRTNTSSIETPAGRALRVPPPLCAIAFVPSSTRANMRHAVMRHLSPMTGEETWGCSCEAMSFRPDRECRHVKAVKAQEFPAGTQLTPEAYVVLGMLLGPAPLAQEPVEAFEPA